MRASLKNALAGLVNVVGLATILIGLLCLLIGLYSHTGVLMVLGVILWYSGFLIGDSSMLIHRFL